MNFIAIIGIVEALIKPQNGELSTVKIKVEKPFLETSDEEWYDTLEVNLDKTIFRIELDAMSKGCIVGIKGRIKYANQGMQLIGERVQVF